MPALILTAGVTAACAQQSIVPGQEGPGVMLLGDYGVVSGAGTAPLVVASLDVFVVTSQVASQLPVFTFSAAKQTLQGVPKGIWKRVNKDGGKVQKDRNTNRTVETAHGMVMDNKRSTLYDARPTGSDLVFLPQILVWIVMSLSYIYGDVNVSCKRIQECAGRVEAFSGEDGVIIHVTKEI